LGEALTADELLTRHAAAWQAATVHPFLAGVRDGSVLADAFDRWLAQDYLFAQALVRAQSSIAAGAPFADVGAQPYREFVERWTTDGFRSYVGDLQAAVDRQLEASVGEQAREAEDAFLWVTHYERGFWDMAMSVSPGFARTDECHEGIYAGTRR
jgi:thiaminase